MGTLMSPRLAGQCRGLGSPPTSTVLYCMLPCLGSLLPSRVATPSSLGAKKLHLPDPFCSCFRCKGDIHVQTVVPVGCVCGGGEVPTDGDPSCLSHRQVTLEERATQGGRCNDGNVACNFVHVCESKHSAAALLYALHKVVL